MSAYTPVIKAKANDLAAFMQLSAIAKSRIKPLIEAPIFINNGNVETNVGDASAILKDKLANSPFYFDPLGVESSARQIAAFEVLSEAGCSFTPTVGLGRGPIDEASLSILINKYQLGICVRLELADLEDSAEDTWTRIIQLSSNLGLSASKVEIFIDYRQIDKYQLNDLIDTSLDFLALQPKAFSIGSVTILGSSALSSVVGIDPDGTKPIQRRELQLWAAINFELDGSRDVRFGDYGILNPDFVFSGPNPNANAKIRYTHGSKIVYFRGHGLYKPSRFDQYHDLARRVCNSSVFLGRDFSYGDGIIQQCADHETGPGNLATWVKVDTNHHAELTALQISEMMSGIQRLSNKSEVRELVESL